MSIIYCVGWLRNRLDLIHLVDQYLLVFLYELRQAITPLTYIWYNRVKGGTWRGVPRTSLICVIKWSLTLWTWFSARFWWLPLGCIAWVKTSSGLFRESISQFQQSRCTYLSHNISIATRCSLCVLWAVLSRSPSLCWWFCSPRTWHSLRVVKVCKWAFVALSVEVQSNTEPNSTIIHQP